jgi:integrase
MQRRPRGTGTIFREGPSWSVRYGPAAARRYETGFRTKAEAERRLALLRAESMQRRLGPATDPLLSPTLKELAAPWLEGRETSHAAGAEDGSRWRKHLEPFVGHLRPDDVDTARIRAFVLAKRETLKPGTIRVCLSILSSLYEDLLERQLATRNPARGLPKSILRLVRPDHDPETTPFLERLEDVRRVFLALPEPFHVAFAIGALAGLRTGEVFTLRWVSVDLVGRRILVREGGAGGRTKDKEPRPVPILDALLPVLEEWRLRHPGAGRVVPSLRADGERMDKHTPGPVLRAALERLRFGALATYPRAWYAATRHTFASQWAMAGRPLRELQKILGHSSIAITERYAHLAPDYWAPGVHGALDVDLCPGGKAAEIGHGKSETSRAAPRQRRNH